ncbi:MAG: nucleic acid-binding protein, partial [Myxococcota bacterium]
DYELRRELIRAGKTRGLRKLDQLTATLRFLPITTEQMRRAATIWADMRKKGKPTANDSALDGDVILAAQAESIASDNSAPLIATTNTKHLSEIAVVVLWEEMLTGGGDET